MTIQEYLLKTIQFLGLDKDEVKIDIDESEERIKINLTVPEDREKDFVGLDNGGIYALQHLVRATFNKTGEEKKITVDINNIFQQQEELFVKEIESFAREVLSSGQEKVLKNLNSYERYLAHAAVSNNKEFAKITTFSKTVGMQRWLFICLKDEVEKLSDQELDEQPEN